MTNQRPAERPLSPHLTIYRPVLTMVMSIMHRITGSALYVGTLLVVVWLVCAATGPEAFEAFRGFIGSWFGRFILFGYTWVLLHHMLGGVRHFVWDTGRGFEPAEREWLARATIVGSAALTVLVWVVGLTAR